MLISKKQINREITKLNAKIKEYEEKSLNVTNNMADVNYLNQHLKTLREELKNLQKQRRLKWCNKHNSVKRCYALHTHVCFLLLLIFLLNLYFTFLIFF